MKKLSDLGVSPMPWNIKYFEFPVEYGCGRVVGGIVSQNGGARIDWNMGIADARLIAAAPELYEALAAMLSCAEREAPFTAESGMSIAMDMARKAIAKASGESENI